MFLAWLKAFRKHKQKKMAQFEEFVIKLKDQFSGKLRDADDALDDTRESADELNSSFDKMKTVAGAAVAALGLREFVQATGEFSKMRAAVMAYTGESGKASDDLISNANAISATYGGETTEILRAANAMTKQVGGSMESNMNLIVAGFQKGANANGEFINQLIEYPVFMKEAGLSAAQSIALITQASKEGIYDDKAFDSVKEMTLSLTEMTTTQRDAINNIGIDAGALLADMSSGATSPFQAMQKIVGVMDDFDISAQKTIVADIFKGAGEDSGLAFIKSLETIDLELGNLEDTGNSYTDGLFKMNTMFEGLKTTVLSAVMPAMGGLMTFIAENKPLLLGLAAAVGVMATAIGLMTVQTWLLNTALFANPIVLVGVAIAALIGLVVYAYNEFETFRGIMDGIGKVVGYVAGLIWDQLVGAFNMIKTVISSVIDWFIQFAPMIKKYMLMALGFVIKLNPIYWLVQAIKKIFPELYATVMDKFNDVFGWLIKKWNKLKKFFGMDVSVNADISTDDKLKDDPAGDGSELTVPTGGGILGTNPNPSSAAAGSSNIGSGVGSVSNSAPKTFNINIDSLISNFSINTENIETSTQRIRDMVLETLLSAVNDVQTAID